MKERKDLIVLLIVYGVLILLPLFFSDNVALINLLIICLIYAVVAGSWDLLMGSAGIFSFASVAFFVIGGYASAIITSHFNISPWLGIISGGGIAAVVGLIIGLPCMRIKGSYIALITFAFHMLLEPLLKSNLGTYIGTGGAEGIVKISKLSIGGYTFSQLDVVIPFYTTLTVSFAAFYIIYIVIHSKWGVAFNAIRDNEQLANSLGIDDFNYKLVVFGISSFLSGSIGAYYAHYVGVLSARLLGLDMFLTLLIIQVVGGQGLFPGALIGSFIITFASEYLRFAGVYRLVIFGALVIVLCRVLPQGIMGIVYTVTRKISHIGKKGS